ncbi:hypothetical protein BSL78_17540 [Apostichopus japonicus]|uniref:Endonuclease/exonuclease/phosphatase domain-containing protein n=1 Tax=Stichopus japonicus TaxID=307972 RepID=A0A2G8KCA6_STIJA|nr:hypothetical protein BSL78_17540 [Apostichopus japonicus]
MQAANYHIQEAIRVIQAVEIYNFQQSLNIPEDEPVIYAGDLNADRINRPQHAAEVIDALRAGLPEIVGELAYTYDQVENDVFWAFQTGRLWLDYALFSVEHELPVLSTLEVVRPRASVPVEVCMIAPLPINRAPVYPESPTCRVSKNITDLSDHYAVVGVFDYDQSKIVITTTQPPENEVTEGSDGARLEPKIVILLFTAILTALHFLLK